MNFKLKDVIFLFSVYGVGLLIILYVAFPQKFKFLSRFFERRKRKKMEKKAAKLAEKNAQVIYSDLNYYIVGQETAKRIISKTVGEFLAQPFKKKPLVMLFVGETGTGKTETVKVLGRTLSTAGYQFFRINCERIQDRHEVSSYFGAPRGYIGSDSVPPLIQKVAESRGNLLLLLDEFEKAHPDFRTAFLSVMDEGVIQFATTGELLPMHSSVIVLTSNALREEIRELSKLPPVEALLEAKRLLEGKFPTELLGRVQTVVPFFPLTREELLVIMERALYDAGFKLSEDQLESLYLYFKEKGVLQRGAREVINTIKTYKLFPEELYRALSSKEPAKISVK